MKTFAIAAGITWVVAAFLYLGDATQWAGAHPFWADQVLLTGVFVGTLLAGLTTKIGNWSPAIGFAVLSVMSFSLASYGKNRFAASFAEDTFGGQLWFFGWHAFCAFTVAAIAAVSYRTLVLRGR